MRASTYPVFPAGTFGPATPLLPELVPGRRPQAVDFADISRSGPPYVHLGAANGVDDANGGGAAHDDTRLRSTRFCTVYSYFSARRFEDFATLRNTSSRQTGSTTRAARAHKPTSHQAPNPELFSALQAPFSGKYQSQTQCQVSVPVSNMAPAPNVRSAIIPRSFSAKAAVVKAAHFDRLIRSRIR